MLRVWLSVTKRLERVLVVQASSVLITKFVPQIVSLLGTTNIDRKGKDNFFSDFFGRSMEILPKAKGDSSSPGGSIKIHLLHQQRAKV